ncbi:MAG: hypothetical protein ACPL07_01615, partial [Candidatus Bathyarchaeia archaeon]
MHPPSVQVIRSPPRDRSRFEYLVGLLSVSIEPISYLHVGSTQQPLQVKEEELVEVLNRYGGLTEEAIRSVTFEDKYLSFHMTDNLPSIPASSVKGNIR